MNTFLPYPDYVKSASVLDDFHPGRLGNQCYREGLTLINGGWSNHPASKMWLDYRGVDYRYSLCDYLMTCADEMSSRGRVEVGEKWFFYYMQRQLEFEDNGIPPWIGDERVHSSHRGCLLAKNVRKEPDWYFQFGWKEKPTPKVYNPAKKKYEWPYYWPE